MWKQKLGISLGNRYEIPTEQVVGLVGKIGFDAISPVWEAQVDLRPVIEAARQSGLALQSLHGPVRGADAIWSEDTTVSGPAMTQILEALEDCHAYEIPVMVLHSWIGYREIPAPTRAGLEHYEVLIKKAEAYGIRIAFENAEGEEQLDALMKHFADCPTVGYCWDSGHEMCYNHSEDLLGKYGQHLIMMHLNDNLGISRFDGMIQGRDDIHLLPFDGIADWEDNVKRLLRCPALEYLNFEVKIKSKPGRLESLHYERMGLEIYMTECYKRACKIADMMRRGALHET